MCFNYEINLTNQEANAIIQKEEEAMRGLTVSEVKTLQRIFSRDAFALWLHIEKLLLLRGNLQ
jgi:hypothetical protein